jgi:hypothetical protein
MSYQSPSPYATIPPADLPPRPGFDDGGWEPALEVAGLSRSPLILGANLTKLDEFTRSLITNKEIIAIDQTAVSSAEIPGDPADSKVVRIWLATTGGSRAKHYLAVFNLRESRCEKILRGRPP